MPFRMGPWEIGLVVLLVLIVFGVGKLPQVGVAIGKGLRSFLLALQGEVDSITHHFVPTLKPPLHTLLHLLQHFVCDLILGYGHLPGTADNIGFSQNKNPGVCHL